LEKVAIGARTILYPLPTVLVAALVDGKPSLSAYAWCGIVDSRPPMISVSLNHTRHTLKGIKQYNSFSVNIPSVDIVKETDYCGIVSGKDTDKVADCKFTIFAGKIPNTPMIKECPVNLECRVFQIINLGSHEMVVGQIEEVYVSDSCLTDGEPDVRKINQFLWVTRPDNHYWTYGKPIGEAFNIGKAIKKIEAVK
jgi:flavin reductase (DIM6/NTAB) family NADH-FMN oxidoreductase RutF